MTITIPIAAKVAKEIARPRTNESGR